MQIISSILTVAIAIMCLVVPLLIFVRLGAIWKEIKRTNSMLKNAVDILASLADGEEAE